MGKYEELAKKVEELIAKAANANDSADALRFSQAACNAANAMCALNTVKRNSHTD